MHRMGISGKANYEPNSINNNWPRETPPAKKDGGFSTHAQPLSGEKVRVRSESFNDYYSQPRLFWLSQTKTEQDHIVGGFSFELGKVVRPWIRERVVDQLTYIDHQLAARVAENVGLALTKEQLAHPIPKDVNGLKKDAALSLYGEKEHPVKSRQVALLVADGVCGDSVAKITAELNGLGIHTKIFAPRLGKIKTLQGKEVNADGTIEGNPSVLVDGVIVVTGKECIEALLKNGNAKNYLLQAFKHLKAIGLQGEALKLYQALPLPKPDEGVLVDDDAKKVAEKFVTALKKHRVWSREAAAQEVPA